MSAPVGTLKTLRATADTETLDFRPERRAGRGILELGAGAAIFAVSAGLVARSQVWYGWMLAVPPLLVCAVLAARGLQWLFPRPLFQIDVDRRARALRLSMSTEQGQARVEAAFSDVHAVQLADREGAWTVSLPLRDGRRIGLGCFTRREDADAVTARFAGWLGVDVRRPS
jgi:hypothetical protein